MLKIVLAAAVAVGTGAMMAQDMVAAQEAPKTVTEAIDPDKGPEIVKEAEQKQPEVKAEQEKMAQEQEEKNKFIPAAEAVRKLLKTLKLREGYDRKKKAIIVIGEAAIKVSDPASDTMFMNTRAMKAMEAYLNAKAEIVRSINNDVRGVDRVACQAEFGEEKVEKVIAEKKAAFEAKKAEFAKKLEQLDMAEAEAFRGVTLSDRFGALLDAIIKKLDGSYAKEKIAAEKKALYDAIKEESAVLAEEYKLLEEQVKNLPKYPQNELSNDAVMISKMPILGASVLVQSEAWDEKEKVYEVAMAVVWSPKLQANAFKLIRGDLTPLATKGKYSIEDWLEEQYLPNMIGSRRIVDNEGQCVFFGIGAADISGRVIDRKAKKALADSDAIQAVARSLFTDIDAYRETKRNLKEYTDDLSTSKARLAEVTSSRHDVNLKGCSRVKSMECVHPISKRRTYVTVYCIDPDLNKEASALMRKAYADAGLSVKAIQYERGLHAGQQQALENVRKSKAEYNRGVNDGKSAVNEEMKKVEAARKPRQNGSLGASGSNRPDETRKSTGGTFTGDNAVDTNF